MLVRELKALLEHYDDNDVVQFHDRTYDRLCPVNSSYPAPFKNKEPEGRRTLFLSNTIGEQRQHVLPTPR